MGEDHDKDWISYFDTDFPCSVCDRWCKSEKELKRHMKIHHNKRSKDCNFCDNEIGNKDEIVDHNDKKAEEIVYKYQRSESEEEKSVPCN